MSKEIAPIEHATPDEQMVSVPSEQLKLLIAQNRQAKEDNAKLLSMLHSSVEVLAFMKNKILGGKLPKDMNVMAWASMAVRIPKILNSLDESTISALSHNMSNIIDCAGEFLTEEQIKQIQ